MNAPEWQRVARAFGIVLKTARMGAGLSQHKLARAARISNNYPGLMERGVQQPTLSTLIAVAAAIGVRPELLLSLTVGRLRREVQS